MPDRPSDATAYELSPTDETLIRHVFGEAFLVQIRFRVYALDLGSEVYKAAYIPSRNEIWLNRNTRIEPLTILHEVTHFYQKNRLGRAKSEHCSYELPPDLSSRMDVEQEAMLVMDYAAVVDGPLCGTSNRILPPLDAMIRYLHTYMFLYPDSPPDLRPAGAAPLPSLGYSPTLRKSRASLY